MSQHIYTTVTNSIIEQLEKGTAPWVRPWSENTVRDGKRGRMQPHNVVSNRDYNGINVLILSMTAMTRGYPTGAWATYKQTLARGGQVRKGEKGTMIVYFDRIRVQDRDNKDETKLVPLIKSFIVFNAAQADWTKDPFRQEATPEVEETGPEPIADCEATIEASGAAIVHSGNCAMYVPSTDQIFLPAKKQFKKQAGYYSTVFHELTHWTGAKSRLDRDLSKGRFGNPEYAFEELIAELGSAFLCAKHGVDGHLEHNAAYIKSWLRALRDEPQAIFKAASMAQKAADYVLYEQEEVEEAA